MIQLPQYLKLKSLSSLADCRLKQNIYTLSMTLPTALLFTVIDKWVEPRSTSSARLCEIFSKFWLFTSKICQRKTCNDAITAKKSKLYTYNDRSIIIILMSQILSRNTHARLY